MQIQNGEVEECQGELRQLCIAVLHAHAGLRQRSVQLLLGQAAAPATADQPPRGEARVWRLNAWLSPSGHILKPIQPTRPYIQHILPTPGPPTPCSAKHN